MWGLCCCLLSVIKAKKYLIQLELNFAVAKEKVDKQCRWRRAEGVVNQSWHVRTFYISISVKSVKHGIQNAPKIHFYPCPESSSLSLSHTPFSVLIMLLLRYQCLISHPDSKDLIFYFSFLSFNC